MIKIDFDVSEIFSLTEIVDDAQKAVNDAERDLVTATHAKMVELASEKLHTRREMYVESLHMAEEDGVWFISLDAKAKWIDDGMPEHSMLESLLASPKAKTAADGSKYLVVPFEHSKKPSQQTPAQKDLLNTIKKELKSFKVPYKGIETDEQGKPKLGLLHSFDITTKPIKTRQGPGQGHGPLGAVKQGPTGVPFLKGVKIFQHEVEKEGQTSVQRSIMTFRVASSKHAAEGNRWLYPGIEGVSIFEEAEKWAIETFNKDIAPKLIAKLITAIR